MPSRLRGPALHLMPSRLRGTSHDTVARTPFACMPGANHAIALAMSHTPLRGPMYHLISVCVLSRLRGRDSPLPHNSLPRSAPPLCQAASQRACAATTPADMHCRHPCGHARLCPCEQACIAGVWFVMCFYSVCAHNMYTMCISSTCVRNRSCRVSERVHSHNALSSMPLNNASWYRACVHDVMRIALMQIVPPA